MHFVDNHRFWKSAVDNHIFCIFLSTIVVFKIQNPIQILKIGSFDIFSVLWYIKRKAKERKEYMQETVVKKIFRDDTKLWLETSTPNSHNVEIRNFITKDGVTYIVDGKSVTFDISNKELKIAAWLERKFGGSIFLLPKVNTPDNIQTADYLFRDEYWDLKEITGNGKHTIDSNIKAKKKQACNFIIDITNSKMLLSEANRQICLIFKSKERIWLEKIILKKNNYAKVYTREKAD